MPQRLVKSDSKGLYVLLDRRKYRPGNTASSQKTRMVVGQNAWVYPYGGRVSSTHSVAVGGETWTTSDPYVAPKGKPPKVGEGTVEFRQGQVLVKISEKTDKIYLQSHGEHMDRATWDAFAAKVEKEWDELPLKAIKAKLEADVQADDELNAYLKDKGLV